MNDLKDGEVDLIVTSPPYWNAIDYSLFNGQETSFNKPRNHENYKNYLRFLQSCFKESLRVLKNGGFCCIILRAIQSDGQLYAIPYHLVNIMEKIGFIFHEEIIWDKAISHFKRIDTFEKCPLPGSYYPNFQFEHILVFRKEGPNIRDDHSLDEQENSKVQVDEFFLKELANNVWHILTVPPLREDHPCPFPEEIPLRLIQLYSYKGDLVLDPFMGSGITAIVAKALERKFCGYEIHRKFIDITLRRLEQTPFLKSQINWSFERLPDKLL